VRGLQSRDMTEGKRAPAAESSAVNLQKQLPTLVQGDREGRAPTRGNDHRKRGPVAEKTPSRKHRRNPSIRLAEKKKRSAPFPKPGGVDERGKRPVRGKKPLTLEGKRGPEGGNARMKKKTDLCQPAKRGELNQEVPIKSVLFLLGGNHVLQRKKRSLRSGENPIKMRKKGVRMNKRKMNVSRPPWKSYLEGETSGV